MTITMTNPEGPRNQSKYFSQSAKVESTASTTIYVSGQVGMNAEGNIPGEGDLAAQSDQVFANLVAALEAAGAKATDVVKTNVFIVDITPEKLAPISIAMKKYFTQDPMPASTWVGVTGLVDPRLLLEVEATAIIEM